jgi:hypothetical protein
MLKKILLHALFFAAPFAVYALWLFIDRRIAKSRRAGTPLGWRDAPWTWLTLAGLVLTVASLALLGQSTGETPGEYVPPRIEDGEVIDAEVR